MVNPASTYRLQLGPGLTFADATGVVPYLASLGVGAVYTAPLLAAMPGSAHGYDVADPSRVSEVLGGEPGRYALVTAVRKHGLALVVDIVPNHLGVADPRANPAWWDLLRHGDIITFRAVVRHHRLAAAPARPGRLHRRAGRPAGGR